MNQTVKLTPSEISMIMQIHAELNPTITRRTYVSLTGLGLIQRAQFTGSLSLTEKGESLVAALLEATKPRATKPVAESPMRVVNIGPTPVEMLVDKIVEDISELASANYRYDVCGIPILNPDVKEVQTRLASNLRTLVKLK